MGAQIILCDGFEVVPPPEMSDLIYFGSDQSMSNSDESTVTTEEDGTVFSGDSSLGDAAEEEWLEEKPFSFYIVKQHAYDDPEIKAKISEADQEIYRCNKRRIEVASALKAERMESLVSQSEGYRVAFEEKMKEFDTLQESLWNLRCSSSDQLCFSKEELERLIYVAYYQIEYGSIDFEDKDWVLKGTEKPHVTNLSEDALAQKEASIQRVKSMAVELNEVKKKLDAITWKISHFNDQVGSSKKKISDLEGEKVYILEKRDRCYARIKMLRIQRDKGNVAYYKSLAVLRKAKDLAASGNVSDLEVFASSEVDGFMSHWNNDKAFRDEYVKRISLSLCKRQLSRDDRIKDPQVHIVREKQALVKTMKGGEEIHKKNRDDSISNSSQDENVTTDKQKKETREKKKTMDSNSAEESDDMEFTVYEIPKKEEEKVDEETLKERKREEQLEKARLAMERKRKLQEKATAKAAIRAQKEAEKKLQECEKKAKKKAAANSSSPSESDQSQEPEVVRTLAAVSGKEKHQKERSLFSKQRSFRYKHRGRGTEALPKAILNRRRAHKYWVWGISSAALAVTLVLVVLLLR